MSTLTLKNGVTIATEARAQHLSFDDDYLHCELTDGRVISVPLIWYPRLWNANSTSRQVYDMTGDGTGIHWPEIDEDLSVRGFLAGAVH
ncbi:MAG: DUF2442 domain-containing protein [Ardenticatenaceae bacterium]